MRTILIVVCICISALSFSQLTTTASGGNKKAVVGERIGLTDVAIHYDRPAVKGRDGVNWCRWVSQTLVLAVPKHHHGVQVQMKTQRLLFQPM